MTTEPDIKLINGFLEDPDHLFRELRFTVNWDERMRARKTASFGVSYDYSGLTYPESPIPEYLQPVCDQIESTIGFAPNNCLLNYYPDGESSMGYHSDSSEELLEGTGVAIVSLGSGRHIWFRSKADKEQQYKYLLTSGSLLYMDQALQEDWLHAIPKEPDVGERISMTFRHIIKNERASE
ncbi:MAG: alpha-ketoglutarate-dependent dioxygenase AlkB [Planctomyces sp.]|nr:alpha-ketoglutarate-dependent dioxygenase AlkB [Planctomyces sp.]